MADVTELEKKEEEFLFQGTKLACKNELLDRGCFVYGGHWYDEAMNFNQGKGGKIKKEAIIRRIMIKDCLDNWEKTAERCKKAQKFKILNKKEPFDLEIVLQIFAYEDTKDWRYFALEPFSSTLYHYCIGQYNGPPLPSEPQVINQMITAIRYLRFMGCAHGDLNPLNIVVTQKKQIKLSDFRLSKFSYTKCPTNDLSIEIPEICKRRYWLLIADTKIDPELIQDPLEDPTELEDIFAAGCLIFYFLTEGVHPFGDDPESIEKNMKEKNPVNLEKMKEEHSQMYKVALENMIRQPPKYRVQWWREAFELFEDALSLKIDKNKLLGEGINGKVYEGKYEGVAVAVKELKKKSDYV